MGATMPVVRIGSTLFENNSARQSILRLNPDARSETITNLTFRLHGPASSAQMILVQSRLHLEVRLEVPRDVPPELGREVPVLHVRENQIPACLKSVRGRIRDIFLAHIFSI